MQAGVVAGLCEADDEDGEDVADGLSVQAIHGGRVPVSQRVPHCAQERLLDGLQLGKVSSEVPGRK